MKRKLLAAGMVGALAVSSTIGWYMQPTTAQPPALAEQPNGNVVKPIKAPAVQLPIAQVVLFSSGVGYFQREGNVEGNTRLDLSFPSTDVNDLLKSLVMQDLAGGKIGTVGYDSQDPVDKTLKSFALDLTYNPSFGQILNQARGEKIEVVMQQTNNAQPGTLTGVVVGMEVRKGKPADGEVELLNLLCVEGMRTVPLDHIQRVRFLNPALDGDFRRALEVLATTHDSQKKSVSLLFAGEGKRNVRVGYVVENPLWKTSYRLVLNKDGQLHLQGWALVENTQDEDWSNVRLMLISGRPISFQMDLYQPLYVPRPSVEPELFASLRPPAYNGALANFANPFGPGPLPIAASPPDDPPSMDARRTPGLGQMLPPGFVNRYQPAFSNPFNPFAAQMQVNAIGVAGNGNGFTNRLSYADLQQRKLEQKAAKEDAKKVGSMMTGLDPTQGFASVAEADDIGDRFQYSIDQKVNLARQKSTMLPIIDEKVEGTRVSIYNEAVHAKFPLLGLKFKNTTSNHLMQGPITIYEGGVYAGDARILDLQPNEERLISYAVDTGTEVKAEKMTAPEQLIAVKLVKGVLTTSHKLRTTQTYRIRNRSDQERTLLIEHPIDADWKLVSPEKPAERSRDVYRFAVKVPAGKSSLFEVVFEQTRPTQIALTSAVAPMLNVYLTTDASTPAVKEAIKKVIRQQQQLADTRKELSQIELKLKRITDDQARLRANLEKVPANSEAHKRYLEKFDKQETEIEKFQETIQQKQEALEKQLKEYEDGLAGLNAE